MFSFRHGRRQGLALTVAAFMVAGLGASAQGAVSAPGESPRPLLPEATSSSADLTKTAAKFRKGKGEEATERALKKFWSSERMRSALPADQLPGLAEAGSTQEGLSKAQLDAVEQGRKPANPQPGMHNKAKSLRVDKGRSAPPQAPAAGSKLAADSGTGTAQDRQPRAWEPANAQLAATSGKVFFTDTTNNLNYVCSGTVVNSEGRNIVWTAGHCVHGGAGQNWHANWVFVPAYYYGTAPYGFWSARELWSLEAWTNSTDFSNDLGAAVLFQNDGLSIVDRVGAQGIAWGYSKDYEANAFGYPAAPPFDGGKLLGCSGVTAPEWVFGPWSANTLKLPCDMTGGSSGGAWLRWFDGNTGLGWINGLNSYGYEGDPHMYSPYFSSNAEALYNAVRYL
ncbi:trypsin-like serine peptidase [Kineosporia babensis]|uniref:V8-like Glu-specific endopeptidase n=1 Tax=Kineosporia babensis TaxID=499548 RepID=A0A9X1SWU3_9ACTN|nr:hypothetical protein [Kineosporia babensis]MCD5309793.1 hypothetical protein [Kineosporia babensis]